MPFMSTRGAEKISAPEAIVRGIAPDGGLYAPLSLPNLSREDFIEFAKMDYPARAARTLALLLDGFTEAELLEMARAAYARFDDPQVAPVKELKAHRHVLELFHGPTMAFKDMALQMLPWLMTASARKQGEMREIAILTATSGDTGKAALEGFQDVPGTSVTVFYPLGGVSAVQEKQMVTSQGKNVHVTAVRGNFDDAQTGVKTLFADPEFIAKMNAQGKTLSSANSINLGRLAPQVAYYLSACADLLAKGAINWEDGLNVCVPTGNFGNILAAWYAKRMGAPIAKLICASNKNDVLADFIRTGIYDRRRDFHKTISPSMDILISSNLERFLLELCQGDCKQVAEWMKQLSAEGKYDIGAERLAHLQQIFYGGYADDERTAGAIQKAWQEEKYLLDPHTAVAACVADDYRRDTGDEKPMLIVSTASPYKFASDVADALNVTVEGDAFAAASILENYTGVKAPDQVAKLKDLPVLHSRICDKEKMGEAVLAGFND
ncbi:MAG: threonine synthase [Clostridiales bacterium]|nr:threonine synthase [Clostridiales bacterium]